MWQKIAQIVLYITYYGYSYWNQPSDVAPQESRLESGMYSCQYLETQLAVALGGRFAEEIIYRENMVMTGASNDIQQVANIAKHMADRELVEDEDLSVLLQLSSRQQALMASSNRRGCPCITF